MKAEAYIEEVKDKNPDAGTYVVTPEQALEAIKIARQENRKVLEDLIFQIDNDIEQEKWVIENPKGYHPNDILQASRIYETGTKYINIIKSKLNQPINDMEGLVGQKFKRNTKNGLSIWTDTIEKVWCVNSVQLLKSGEVEFIKPMIQVKGKNSVQNYDIDEVVIVI